MIQVTVIIVNTFSTISRFYVSVHKERSLHREQCRNHFHQDQIRIRKSSRCICRLLPPPRSQPDLQPAVSCFTSDSSYSLNHIRFIPVFSSYFLPTSPGIRLMTTSTTALTVALFRCPPTTLPFSSPAPICA